MWSCCWECRALRSLFLMVWMDQSQQNSGSGSLVRIVTLIAGLVAETNVPLADVVKLAPEPRLAVTPTAGAEEVSKLGNLIFLFISRLL
ncbi:UNVERIFIED_CONTAM: hypothetical protein H355_008562 [Colinus virginianus]|nr:hypothetical protein H355_008562 [Colinus virginianus]